MFFTNDNVYTYSTRQRIMYQVPRCRLESKRNSLCFIGVRYFNTILSPSNLDILYSRQALCFSSAEYASPVWSRSSHASKIDPVLNAASRTISGIALPPYIRRAVSSQLEKHKQENDHLHPLYEQDPARKRIKSRHSSLHSVQPLGGSAHTRRLTLRPTISRQHHSSH